MRLKKHVVDLSLDNEMLQEVVRKKLLGPVTAVSWWIFYTAGFFKTALQNGSWNSSISILLIITALNVFLFLCIDC